MTLRDQSGYDSVGDPRTGRPPLPGDREQLKQASIPEFRASSTENESLEEDSGSIMDKIATGSSGAAQSLKQAGEAVTSEVSAVTSAAMERGSAMASIASEQMQTYANELIAVTRRRPLTALAAAAILGFCVKQCLGVFRRNRSSG
jgi:hypothetical protein